MHVAQRGHSCHEAGPILPASSPRHPAHGDPAGSSCRPTHPVCFQSLDGVEEMPTATHRHHKGRRRKGQSCPAWQSLTDGQEGTSAQAPRVRAGTLQNPAHCERRRRKQPERAQQQRKLRGPGSFAGDTGQLGAGVRGRNASCAERDRGMHFSSWVGTVSVQPSATRLSDSPSWDTEAHPVINTPLLSPKVPLC